MYFTLLYCYCFKRSQYFFHSLAFDHLLSDHRAYFIQRKHVAQFEKMVPDFCLSSLMNDSHFEDHLFPGSSRIALKKVWNNSADLSSRDFVPRTICTQDQRGPQSLRSNLWKDQEEHLPALLTSPGGVFVILLVLRMIREGVSCEGFCLTDQYLKWFVSGAGWSQSRDWNLFVTDWIGNQLLWMPFLLWHQMSDPSDPSHASLS